MKKLLLLLATACASVAVQAQKTHVLSSIISDSDAEKMLYFYDEEQKLDSTWSDFRVDQQTFSKKFIYDDKGQLVRLNGYQILDGDDFFTNTIRIDYTYDEKGRMATRINYNRDPFGTEYLMGGIYEYVYGEDGYLKQRLGYLDVEKKHQFERSEFVYSADGKILSEDMYHINSAGETYVSGIDYKYTDAGKLKLKMLKALDRKTDEIYCCGGEEFTYNDEGDVVGWIRYANSPSNPSQKSAFKHDPNMLTADVVLPENPEEINEVALNTTHVIAADSVYTMDMQTGTLFFYGVYNYTYEAINPSGITDAKAYEEVMQVYLSDNRMMVNGVNEGEVVRVFDMAGNLVKQENYQTASGIDVASMPAGVYCVSSSMGLVKFCKP